jgi:uncharacterized LabA/DUF88 family protein
VFKKGRREEKAKGVDIALTTDVLSDAFLDNYDAMVLIAGDRDYLPVVEAVKRQGKLVTIAFFEDVVHDDLRHAADGFIDLTETLERSWRRHAESLRKIEARARSEASKRDRK